MGINFGLATYIACIDHCVETVTYGLRVGSPSQFGDEYIDIFQEWRCYRWKFSVGGYMGKGETV